MIKRRRHCLSALSLLVTICQLAGCVAGPSFVRPNIDLPEHFLPSSNDEKPRSDTLAGQVGTEWPDRWWQMFGSAALDGLMAESLGANPSLERASATLEQANDLLSAGHSIFFPSVSGVFGASRERYTAPGSHLANVFSVFALSGSVNYLVDVFGGSRRRIEALGASTDIAQDEFLAAYLSLTANVANTAIARASYWAQVQALRDMVSHAETMVLLAGAQVNAGAAGEMTLLAATKQLADFRAVLALLELRAQQADHLQAVLAGRMPANSQLPVIGLEHWCVPESIPVSVPSALVRQRPDIRAAEANLHRASAEIGVATADLFPTLSLSGSLGNNTAALPDLGRSAGKFWSGSGAIEVPIFQGGRSIYSRRAAIHAYQAAQASYRQVVLSAFQQVADALRAVEHDSQGVSTQRLIVELAQSTYAIAQANASAGLIDGLALMSADIALKQAEYALDAALAVRLQDAVALYVALGGGWWVDGAPISERLLPPNR